MFKKPENIAPLPSGMMDAFDRAVEQQVSPYDVPLSQRPIAEEPKAEESIDLEEDAKTLTANRPLRQGKAQYKADNEKSTKEKTKEVEALVSEDDTKEKYRTAGKKSEKEMTKDAKALEESDDDKELDKVDSKAAKKKFDDREDKDIDNDGDEDESDKYLHLRRKAIAKAIDKKKSLDEESDQLDEYVGGIGKKIKSKIQQKIGGFSKKGDTGSYRADKTRVKTNDDRRIDDSKERSSYNRLVALHKKVNTMISNDAKTTSSRAVQRTKDGEKVKQPKNDNFENKAFQQRVKSVRDQIKSIEATVKTTTARAASKAASAKKQNSTESVNEAKENSYTVVHAKKGKVVVTAPTSYAAAEKAAKQWKLKSTAGVDSYLMEGSSVKKSESFFSEEMDPTDHVKYNKDTDMYCVYDKDSKKVYESDSEEEANNYAIKNHKSLMGESVQLDEVRGKLNAKGEIEMTKANFAKVHKDFKTKIKGQPFAMQIDPKSGGSALFPVKFIKEEVALDEKYQQFTDKTPNWGEGEALTYGRKKGYKEVAVMGDGKGVHAMVLFALNAEDKKFVRGANVKSGESVFRYTTKISIAGDIFPLVKVNIAKGIFYPLTQESSDGSIETAKFETRGVKLKFFRSLEGVKLESIEEAVDSADVDQYVATKGDKDSAKMNIIVQLRKAADVKGNIDIVFQDGNRKRIPVNIIKIALDKFNSFKRPANKEKLVNAMSKSYKGMLTALKTIKEYSKY